MPARSDDPLRRVTLNLYEADCILLEQVYGNGWTTMVRDAAHKLANEFRHHDREPRQLGDLPHD